MAEIKKCVLYDKNCTNCGECNMCDLEPSKICDNCGKCIDSGDDYNTFDVDLIIEDSDMPLNYTDEFVDSTIDDDYDDFSDGDYNDFDELPYLDDEDFDDENVEDDDNDDDDNLRDLYGEFFGDF